MAAPTNVGYLQGDLINWSTEISKANGTTYIVTTNADLQAKLDIANPGDVIRINNATCTSWSVTITRSGTVDQPILITGAAGVTPNFTGAGTRIYFNGCDYVWFGGVTFTSSYYITSDAYSIKISNQANFNRITNITFTTCGYSLGSQDDAVIELDNYSNDNKLDHLYFLNSHCQAILITAWNGARQITSITSSGTTGTFTYNPTNSSGTLSLQTGDVVNVTRSSDPLYDLEEATITRVSATQFTATLSGTPSVSTAQVHQGHWTQSVIKRDESDPQRTEIAYCTVDGTQITGAEGMQIGQQRYSNQGRSYTKIHHCILTNINAQGISLKSNDCHVYNNDFSDDGCAIRASRNCIYERNYARGFESIFGQDIIIRNNVFRLDGTGANGYINIPQYGPFWDAGTGGCNAGPPNTGLKFLNNTIIKTSTEPYCIVIGSRWGNATNNGFCNNGGTAGGQTEYQPSDLVIKNNIIVANNTMTWPGAIWNCRSGGTSLYPTANQNAYLTANNITIDNNLTFISAGGDDIYGNITEVTSITTDPGLVNEFEIPNTSSSAHDAGETLADVTDDYNSSSRPGGASYDIGAYEFQSANNLAVGNVDVTFTPYAPTLSTADVDMAAITFYNNATKHLNNGDIDLDTDTIKISLHTATHTPAASDDTWADLDNEVSGTNYTTRGAALTTVAVATTGSTANVTCDNVSWAANTTSGFNDARYGVLYKDTGVNTTSYLIGYYDFTTDKGNNVNTFQLTISNLLTIQTV